MGTAGVYAGTLCVGGIIGYDIINYRNKQNDKNKEHSNISLGVNSDGEKEGDSSVAVEVPQGDTDVQNTKTS